MVFITVLVFGCLNHWHWKASIISHLSIILPQTPFKSLEELVDSSYQITTIGDSYYSKFWSEAQDGGLLKTIAETKFLDEDASLKSSEEEALAQTQSGPFAFFMVYSVGINFPEYKECKIEDVGFFVGKMDLALGFPKSSPYQDIFHHEMRRMKESGELERIALKYKPEGRTCGGGGKGRTLGFKNIILVFFILGLGLLLSIGSFLLELAINMNKRN